MTRHRSHVLILLATVGLLVSMMTSAGAAEATDATFYGADWNGYQAATYSSPEKFSAQGTVKPEDAAVGWHVRMWVVDTGTTLGTCTIASGTTCSTGLKAVPTAVTIKACVMRPSSSACAHSTFEHETSYPLPPPPTTTTTTTTAPPPDSTTTTTTPPSVTTTTVPSTTTTTVPLSTGASTTTTTAGVAPRDISGGSAPVTMVDPGEDRTDAESRLDEAGVEFVVKERFDNIVPFGQTLMFSDGVLHVSLGQWIPTNGTTIDSVWGEQVGFVLALYATNVNGDMFPVWFVVTPGRFHAYTLVLL